NDHGKRLLGVVRAYLQAEKEPAGGPRWPYDRPLCLYPLLPGPELGPRLDGQGRDLGPDGLTFLLPEKPPTEHVYLHLDPSGAEGEWVLLAHITGTRPGEAGWYEVEAVFAEAPVPVG